MESILVSIVVPVYNTEKYIERCIQSILRQTYKNFELILIDDGSSDDSGKICDRYSEQDERIKVIHNANEGVSSARNFGLNIACGEWVTFIDADDWIREDTLECLKNQTNKNDIICFSYSEIYPNKTVQRGKHSGEFQINRDEIRKLELKIIDKNLKLDEKYEGMKITVPWGKFIKRKFLQRNNIKFIKNLYGEDMIFNLYCFHLSSEIKYIDEPYYYYFHQKQSLYNGYRKGVYNELENMTNEMEKFIQTYYDDSKLEIPLRKRRIVNLLYGLIKDYCNQSNQEPYQMRKKEFLQVRNKMSIKIFDIKGFPVIEKIAILLAYFRMFGLLNVLNCIKQNK